MLKVPPSPSRCLSSACHVYSLRLTPDNWACRNASPPSCGPACGAQERLSPFRAPAVTLESSLLSNKLSQQEKLSAMSYVQPELHSVLLAVLYCGPACGAQEECHCSGLHVSTPAQLPIYVQAGGSLVTKLPTCWRPSRWDVFFWSWHSWMAFL